MNPTCEVPQCQWPVYALRLCEMHYRRLNRWGTTTREQSQRTTCTVTECVKPHMAKGYCVAHYSLFRKYGTPTPNTKYRKGHITKGGYRKIYINGEYIFEHR